MALSFSKTYGNLDQKKEAGPGLNSHPTSVTVTGEGRRLV